MTESPISHVTDTAFWVATYRANEGERADALFHDPLAARLVDGRGRAIAAQMTDSAMTAWSVVVRTRIIDELLLQAIAAGCDAVVNLGAGLDTRPYRLDLPAALPWIEVDFPDTIAFKETRLAGERPRCALRRVATDLANATARRALLDEIAAGVRSAFVLTEGVILYLSNDDVGALADDLHARPTFTRWLVEYLTPGFLERIGALNKQRRQQLVNAPMQFNPADWTAFFSSHGWRARETRYTVLEAERLGRRPPISWKRRLLSMVTPPRQREALRRGFGYAVLGPSLSVKKE